MATVLEKVGDIGRFEVTDFCEPLDVKSFKTVEVDLCSPVITAFQLPDEIEQVLVPLSEAYPSSVFMKLWEDQCRQQENDCTSLKDIASLVWQPVSNRYIYINHLTLNPF